MCKVNQARMAPQCAWIEVPNVYIVRQTTKPTFWPSNRLNSLIPIPSIGCYTGWVYMCKCE